jgi:ubiquinone/menaquinone biosynthesis C-methylase UbiE
VHHFFGTKASSSARRLSFPSIRVNVAGFPGEDAGRLGRLLQERGYRVTAVDASPAMVRLTAGHEIPQPAVVADAAALPFPAGTFDLVVAYMSLHDMDRMPQAVAEAAQLGRVVPGPRRARAVHHRRLLPRPAARRLGG